jgi:hypothetical protein
MKRNLPNAAMVTPSYSWQAKNATPSVYPEFGFFYFYFTFVSGGIA